MHNSGNFAENFFLYPLPQLTRFESDSDADTNLGDGTPSVSSKKPLTDAPCSSPTPCREPTLPHSLCHDKSPEDMEKGGTILHPGQPSCACEENEASQPTDNLTNEVSESHLDCERELKC